MYENVICLYKNVYMDPYTYLRTHKPKQLLVLIKFGIYNLLFIVLSDPWHATGHD